MAEEKRRLTAADHDTLATFILDEHATRKNEKRRAHLEREWKEIDRQLAMEPNLAYKSAIASQADNRRNDASWMPEIELPLQSQTLEVLMADARELQLPDQRNWFDAHGVMTDEYLQGLREQPLVTGSDMQFVPDNISQDDVDMLIEGMLEHWHSQYDLRANVDYMNAEAFKYGTLVGRGRLTQKTVFRDTAQGTIPETKQFPLLAPHSIKNTYLDTSPQRTVLEGFQVGPGHIFERWMYLKDVRMAAQKGSTDPDAQNGGWIPKNLKGLVENDDGMVQLLEWEGDVVIPRKSTRDFFLPNVIATVAVGSEDSSNGNNRRLIRLRLNADRYSGIVHMPYQVEHYDSPYGTSPLLKGRPIQMAASESLQRLMQWAILNTEPPLQYDGQDPQFASGPPEVAPRAKWPSMAQVTAAEIGDGSALQTLYVNLVNQYYDVTGVNAPRLGAQTVSHTTAFAKRVETQRGQSRTVDYVKSFLHGPMLRWLYVEYDIGRRSMTGDYDVYLRPVGTYATLNKSSLPENADFSVQGSAGPALDAAEQERMLNSLQLAMQVDQLKVQAGLGQPMNYDEIQREILRQGGWTDVEQFTGPDVTGLPSQVAGGPAVAPAIVTGSDPASAALAS